MAILNGRVDRLERHFGANDDPGRLVVIVPAPPDVEAASDAERRSWCERHQRAATKSA